MPRRRKRKTPAPTPVVSVPDADVPSSASRRNFIKNGGMILAGSAIVGSQCEIASAAHAFGTDTIKIGLIGCGRRGTAAASQALGTSEAVQLVAMADIFPSSLQSSYRSLRGQHADKVLANIAKFDGLDGYRGVMQSDADVVLLATPPGFRPLHFESAVDAGKHVFMEKPVATDAPGVRRVMAAGELADKKGLAVQVGLQRRHEQRYQQCIARLKDGAIGDPVFARAYWNGSNHWVRPRRKGQSELEYQLQNWFYFTWLSGDLIGEQHIHNLDVINWLLDDHPTIAQGQGGRQTLSGNDHGQIFDQHMVEFGYPNGCRLLSQCRQIRGCWNQVGEQVHGTNGWADISAAKIYDPSGKIAWASDVKESKGKGWQRQQTDFFAALRRGERANETKAGAISTLTAIMGRLATYSGRVVHWNDLLQSDVQLANIDALHSLNDVAPVQLDDATGLYPTPTPGSNEKLI